MAKDKTIKEQLAQQDKDVYGDETPSGTNPVPGDNDNDVDEMMTDAFGSDASKKALEDHKPFDIDEEIENDEWQAAGFTTREQSKDKKK